MSSALNNKQHQQRNITLPSLQHVHIQKSVKLIIWSHAKAYTISKQQNMCHIKHRYLNHNYLHTKRGKVQLIVYQAQLDLRSAEKQQTKLMNV